MTFNSELWQRTDAPFVTDAELGALFPDRSRKALHSAVSRSLARGDLIRLKRGHYVVVRPDDRRQVPLRQVANSLYAPSYLSFESALAWHGLIPEGVPNLTSAICRRTAKVFHTPLATFYYTYIPKSVWRFEICVERPNDKEHSFLCASPIKALFDLVYRDRKKWLKVEDLEEDIRLDWEELTELLKSISCHQILELARQYRRQDITRIAQLVSELCHG